MITERLSSAGPLPAELTSWVASLRTLRAAAATLSATQDLDKLFEDVGEQVALVVPYHTLRLFLYDDAVRELYPVAIHSFVEDAGMSDLANPDLRLPLGKGVTGHIAATRKGEVVYDLEAHPEAYHIPGTPKVEESFVGVPLVFRGELVGVITLSKWGLSQFSSDSLALLEVLGVSVAAAIGHRRAIDAEQRAREEHVRLQQLHQAFIANISHELRTPLTTAAGFLEVALARTDDGDGNRELLDRAHHGMRRLRRLIEDLLEAVSLEAGRQQLDLGANQLDVLVGRACEEAGLPADRLDLHISHGEPVVVDARRIVHVLAELFENALKYGPDGGRIAVSARTRDGSVLVDVTDEGDGIPHDETETIFQRFTQRDPSLRREQGGTGMGLTLARSIARWHGGDLFVAATSPTTFRLQLPIVADQVVRV